MMGTFSGYRRFLKQSAHGKAVHQGQHMHVQQNQIRAQHLRTRHGLARVGNQRQPHARRLNQAR